jgi:transposase
MNPEMSCFEQSTPRTGDEKLSTAMRRLLDFLWQEWKGLQMQIESLNTELEQIASSDPRCVRLQQIPGVGPLVSTAVVSAIGNGAAFKKGREVCGLAGTGGVLEYPGPDLV